MLYKARILKKSNGFSGELMRGRVIECQLDGYVTDAKAVSALNKKINEYNQKHNLSIPLVSVQNHFVSHKTDEPEDEIVITQRRQSEVEAVSAKENNKTLSDKSLAAENQDKDEAKIKKSTKPKRKPFTPYGLNGYLVDKQGNVRLMLDRRASASTIVLEPEMFSALAEMVRKTQVQHNESPKPQ